MTIYRSGYDTTFGSSLVIKPTEHAIKEAIIKDGIQYQSLDLITSLNYRPVFILGRSVSESNIPFFAHPMVVEDHKNGKYICTDLRPFLRRDVAFYGDDLPVRSVMEFTIAKHRTLLELAWLTDSAGQIKTNLNFAGTVFAAWLSENISKRFALDPNDQLMLQVIAHYYYQSLFYPDAVIEEDVLQRFAVHTIKATNAQSRFVLDVFDKITESGIRLDSITAFCEVAKKLLANIRLQDFNVGVLITIIGTNWFGLNAKEMLTIALEHPPTWVAIVYASLNDRSYRKMFISTVAERYGKRGQGDDFCRNFQNVVDMFTLRKAQEDLEFPEFK